MNHTLTRVLTLVTSSVMATFGATANAQSSEPAAAAPVATPVDIVLVGRAGSDGSLAARIWSWFDADVTLSVTTDRALAAESVLGLRPAGVGVWVTLRGPSQARLYFAAAGEADEPTRYLVRDVLLDDGLDEIGSERVAQVVHSSVTALLDDSIEAISRPEVERELTPAVIEALPLEAPVVPKPAPVTSTGSGPRLAPFVGAFYAGQLAGDEGLAHGPGLALGTTLDFGGLGTGVVVRGHYVWPHTERFDDLDVTFSQLAARLGARGALQAGKFELDVELGGGTAWVRYDPEGTASGPLPASRDADQRFFGFVGAGFRHNVGLFQVGARAELELYPLRSHYELDSGREVASSSRYRPVLAFEVVLD